MDQYVGGKDIEERLRTRLENWCIIEYSDTFDHEYKLDFIVTRFKHIHRLPEQIGVQVTTKADDLPKQAELLRIHQDHGITPRTVYLEIDARANMDSAAAVVYAALASLVFDEAHEKDEIIGLWVGRDVSFEFFDLNESIQGLHQQQEAQSTGTVLPDTKVGETVTGEIVTYGLAMGHIVCPARSKGFFFHISEVERMDPELAQDLRDMRRSDPDGKKVDPYIRVEFEDAGYTKVGARSPAARRIRRIQPSP
jgi:hypothetical protein